MQLRYRNYLFQTNSVNIDRRIDVILSQANYPYAEKHTWFVQGEIIGSGQVSLITAMNQAGAALGQPFGDLVFSADDGTVCYQMMNAGSFDGVKIINFRIPPAPDAFATAVPFEFAAEATYIYDSSRLAAEAVILSFQESLRIIGGGPRKVWIETRNGAPVPQITSPKTVCRATQAGSCSGLFGWPAAPGPLWPADELPDQREFEKQSPRRNGNGFWEYTSVWKYEFASGYAFAGDPRIRI